MPTVLICLAWWNRQRFPDPLPAMRTVLEDASIFLTLNTRPVELAAVGSVMVTSPALASAVIV